MTTNNFMVEGLVTPTTHGVRNVFLLVAKDTDDVMYVPVVDSAGRRGWGSSDSKLDTYQTRLLAAACPDEKTFSMRFIDLDQRDTTLGTWYSTPGGTPGQALWLSSVEQPLEFRPTVGVEKTRILTGVWYEIYKRNTEILFGGMCFPSVATSGKWRGVGAGVPVFKNLLFTFIPLNNFIVTGDAKTHSLNESPISFTAFNLWKAASTATPGTTPKCLGDDMDAGCVFTINSPGRVLTSDSKLFGYQYSKRQICSGTTYSSCSVGSCAPVAGGMTCYVPKENNTNQPEKPDLNFWIFWSVVTILLLCVLAYALISVV